MKSIEQLARDLLTQAITDGLVSPNPRCGNLEPQAMSTGDLVGVANLLSEAMSVKPVHLYGFYPEIHCSYSYFVAAESETAARDAVERHIKAEREKYLWSSQTELTVWLAHGEYRCECVPVSEVLTNTND